MSIAMVGAAQVEQQVDCVAGEVNEGSTRNAWTPGGNMTTQSNDNPNRFRFDGEKFGSGVLYSELGYASVAEFTPLSGRNWWRVDRISGEPTVRGHNIDLSVVCRKCGATDTQTKSLRIEVISRDRNIFRVRFDPYAEGPDAYDARENRYGPITRDQLRWIQNQDAAPPSIEFDGKGLTVGLRDVVLEYSANCLMRVKDIHTGAVLHSDGWVTPNGIGQDSQPQGILFVDHEYGSAVAAIKTLPRNAQGRPHYYGCGECQNYELTADGKNHSSNLERTGQVVTFFNYDNYMMNQAELMPKGESSPERSAEQSFIPQYVTAPFFIEYARDASSAYGLLLDNVSQSYVNFGNAEFPGTEDPAGTKNVDGVYYFGAQYPELDYYLVFPRRNNQHGMVADILDGATLLTGRENVKSARGQFDVRGAMPPKYIFGLFQGVYGFTGLKPGQGSEPVNTPVETVVKQYRENQIPLEGLAIDVDVQNACKVFTTNGNFWENGQVGAGRSVFEWAHDHDLVCHTNITCFIKQEEGYSAYDALKGQLVRCSRFVSFDGDAQEGDIYPSLLPYDAGPAFGFPDFGLRATQEIWGTCYWKGEYALLPIGLDFVWQDMTVPAASPHLLGNPLSDQSSVGKPGAYNWKGYHGQQLYTDPRYDGHGTSLPSIALRNLHSYMECKSTYEFGLNPDYLTKYKRSYIISRGGYLGLAHFGGLWTGDNNSGWKYLQIQLPKVLNLGLCGFPITGADMGGFAPNDREDHYNHCQENMMLRWVQAASLLPWYRDHYVNENHQGKTHQELYSFWWPYEGRSYASIMGDFARLRVRLHHLLYTSMYTFCQTGLPPAKPTCLYDGGTSDAESMQGFDSCQDSQYFVGDSTVLVAPAMEDEGCAETLNFPTTITDHPVWFPARQRWFPYDAATDGPCDPGNAFVPTPGTYGCYLGDGQAHPFTVPLQKLPLFIRGGAILPTRIPDEPSKNIQQLDKVENPAPFVFDIWPGESETSYQCYFDDSGKTRNATSRGEYSLLTVRQSSSASTWQVTFALDRDQYALPEYLYLRLRATSDGAVSDSAGNEYPGVSSRDELFQLEGFGKFFDANGEQWIKIRSKGVDQLQVKKSGSSKTTVLSFPGT